MKSYKLTGIEEFKLFETPKPEISGDDVLIEVKRVGICGSDVHYYSEGKIGSQIVDYPWTVGHEGSGVVVAVGSDVVNVKVGDRVAFDPAAPCGRCSQCLSGRPHTCFNLNFLGCPQQIEGCLSEYLSLPETSCLPIPANMTFEEAALVEPLSIAVYAASLASGLDGATAAVLGCGPIGLSMVRSLVVSGVKSIYATDKIDARLAAGSKSGAIWTGNPLTEDVVSGIRHEVAEGLDFVFECCGQQEALDQAVQILKPGGELSIVGIPETNRVSFDINLLRRKEIRIQNVRRQNDCMRKALNLIEQGDVTADLMITHRFSFTKTPEAFDLVRNYRDGVIKAMISFD